jgi:hypothetical protein
LGPETIRWRLDTVPARFHAKISCGLSPNPTLTWSCKRYSPYCAGTLDRQHGTVLPAGQCKGRNSQRIFSVSVVATQRPASDMPHIPDRATDSGRTAKQVPGHTLSLRRSQSRCSLLTIVCT